MCVKKNLKLNIVVKIIVIGNFKIKYLDLWEIAFFKCHVH